MARRRSSSSDGILSDIWQILLATPWWTCPIIAGTAYALLAYLIPALVQTNQYWKLIIPGCRDLAPFAGGVILLMGVAASIVKFSRRGLAMRPATRDTLDSLTWQQFEQMVGSVYGWQGYRVVETGSCSSDGGVYLILHGKGEKVLVQCKQWRNYKVGVKDLREFNGVLKSKSTTANRGVFVTMGTFTQEAVRFARENGIELVDGDRLLRMQKDVQSPQSQVVSPSEVPSPQEAQARNVSELASVAEGPACPLCGEAMVLRTARRGQNAGSKFWGCTSYPGCKGIREFSY